MWATASRLGRRRSSKTMRKGPPYGKGMAYPVASGTRRRYRIGSPATRQRTVLLMHLRISSVFRIPLVSGLALLAACAPTAPLPPAPVASSDEEVAARVFEALRGDSA